MTIEQILDLTNQQEDYILSVRRKIHQHPEVSFKEYETSRLIAQELKTLGVEVREKIAGTGILGIIDGRKKGRTVLIRAEMDALPVREETELPFKSQVAGVMHACGHDVHSANLLGIARILCEIREELAGRVLLMFQPGEERGGGCKKMLEEGFLDGFEVDAALAMHIMPLPKGTVLLSPQNITAYSDGFALQVQGKSAHTSKPQDGIDAIHIAGQIIVALNSITAKDLDPRDAATLSIGTIHGGQSKNIVADAVELGGMIRSTTREDRNRIRTRIQEIAQGTAKTFGGSCRIELTEGYPSVYNDEKLTEKVKDRFTQNYLACIQEIAPAIYREEDARAYVIDHKPMLTADDFGYLSGRIPSVYFMVGTGDQAPGHSSKFFVEEAYIKLCTRMMLTALFALLED